MTINYYLNIGTNKGDRKKNLSLAVAMIEKRFSCTAHISSPMKTDAWGFVSPNYFLNIGVSISTGVKPLTALKMLHEIEVEMGSASHRDARGNYADRIIDIDIVAIDNLVIDTPDLTVPHPHMAERNFVLAPMAELAPQWMHPILHRTAAQLLTEL